jgi:multidrug efflux pump subunit AcrA (membrane-fusion protein)
MSDLTKLTKEQLIALISDLEAIKLTLTAANEAGAAENEAQAAEIIKLKAEIETKEAELVLKTSELTSKNHELASKNEELATAENMLEEQQEALLKLESNSGPSDKTVISFNGNKYILAAPRFLVGSRECTADDLLADSDMVARLIDKRSGILKLIQDK